MQKEILSQVPPHIRKQAEEQAWKIREKSIKESLIDHLQGGYEANRVEEFHGPKMSGPFFNIWKKGGLSDAWQDLKKRQKEFCPGVPAGLSTLAVLMGATLLITGARKKAKDHEGNPLFWPASALSFLALTCLAGGDWGFATKTTDGSGNVSWD